MLVWRGPLLGVSSLSVAYGDAASGLLSKPVVLSSAVIGGAKREIAQKWNDSGRCRYPLLAEKAAKSMH